MGKGARVVVGVALVAALVLPAPAGAGHDGATCWGSSDCCEYYREHGTGPSVTGSKNVRATPLVGARADAWFSYPSASGSFTVTTSARGAAARYDTGLAALNEHVMGSGTGVAEARKIDIACGLGSRAAVTIAFSSQEATGSLAYAQPGEAAESWIEARAYFYAIVCTESTYGGYWSCGRDADHYSTAYARTACYPSYAGGCAMPSSITLSADIPRDGCSVYGSARCSGVYSYVSVFSHSTARGSATASSGATGTIGTTGTTGWY